MHQSHMRKIDKAGDEIYYSMHLCADLFGGYTVVREWGKVGSEGRVLVTPTACEHSALDLVAEIADHQRKRGYSMRPH